MTSIHLNQQCPQPPFPFLLVDWTSISDEYTIPIKPISITPNNVDQTLRVDEDSVSDIYILLYSCSYNQDIRLRHLQTTYLHLAVQKPFRILTAYKPCYFSITMDVFNPLRSQPLQHSSRFCPVNIQMQGPQTTSKLFFTGPTRIYGGNIYSQMGL